MSWHDRSEVEDVKARVQREIVKRKKRGETFTTLEAPPGSAKLAKSFWGKAWNDNLESYSAYEYRLPRGRSYLRQGNVYNLAIKAGEVTSLVTGSEIYEVSVKIEPLDGNLWQAIRTKCEGHVASLLDLLGGKLGDGVMRIITDSHDGLFPHPDDIRFSCTCPDVADMCKHVAATLYGVGVKLDTQPDLFFVLRSVDPTELISRSTTTLAVESDSALANEDLSALFGIELDSPPR